MLTKLSNLPSWAKYGHLYKGKSNDDEVYIPEIYLIKDPFVDNMQDFQKVFNASNFYELYKYPVEIYVFCILNLDEVKSYLTEKNGTYEKLFLKELSYNKCILENRYDITQYMKFNKEYVTDDKYDEIISELEKSAYYELNFEIEK